MATKVDDTEVELAESTAKYIICESAEQAHDLLASVIKEAALDFETTALDPADGEIRITSVCNDDVHFIIDHQFLGPFADFYPHMMGKTWYVYNAKFETRWCDYKLGHDDTIINDVDFMAKSVIGGHPSRLADMAWRDLGVLMDKSEQNSDWSRPALTKLQLDYAAFDSHVTWKIKKHWQAKMNDGHWRGFHVLNDAVRATTEAERTGLILDAEYHQKLVTLWKNKQRTFEWYIRKWTPESVIKNVGSDMQLGKFLEKELHPDLLKVWPRTEKTKRMQMEGKYLKAVARRLPYPMNRWMAAIAGMKYYDKYLSTYGDKLITKQHLAGKITSRFNIAQALTGRYSSSNDNLQNIPRKPVVRRSFYSPPGGTDLMCLADYKGIEVRVLAELSGDAQLLYDAVYADVHIASASAIYGIPIEEITAVLEDSTHKLYRKYKEYRSKAKGFTFQLLYGAGAGALSDVLRCEYDEAVDAINKWAARYPKAYGYRDKMFDIMMQTGYLPVCDGRTIFVWKNERSMPVAANYPIQGAAASVMYRAMYHVRNNLIKHDLDGVIGATVHDELLLYAHRDHAEAVMTQQLEGMKQGWLDIFPGTNTDNLVDYKIGTSWADKP
jgi:DNA polymerase I-like protein with 3'-5' exonuclease and polymerase domains